MKYMLDTNICIFLINKKSDRLIKKIKQNTPNDICISSITYAELAYGVHKSEHHAKNRHALNEFILPLNIAPLDQTAGDHYGQIRAELEKKGTPIGALNLIIAAHARSLQLTLVTNNKKEFSRVSHLTIEDWS